MHVAEACARIRNALLKRSGRVWTAVRSDYAKESPAILLHAKPRYRQKNGEMTLDDRRELAEMLGMSTQQVPADGILVGPPYEEWVSAAEDD